MKRTRLTYTTYRSSNYIKIFVSLKIGFFDYYRITIAINQNNVLKQV